MSIFQSIAVMFGLFMMYIINVQKRKAQLSPTEISFWVALWSLFIILSIFPNLLLGVTQTLNFTRVFDLLVVGAFMVLTSLTLFLYVMNKTLQKQIEELVKSLSIKNVHDKTNQKK
jgi:hypothetical protein